MDIKDGTLQRIEPTHKVTLRCPQCGHEAMCLIAKVRVPGMRRPVTVYPYGKPDCSHCGGQTKEMK